MTEKAYTLGGVDKFEPVSGGSEMDQAEEAIGELVIAVCEAKPGKSSEILAK